MCAVCVSMDGAVHRMNVCFVLRTCAVHTACLWACERQLYVNHAGLDRPESQTANEKYKIEITQCVWRENGKCVRNELLKSFYMWQDVNAEWNRFFSWHKSSNTLHTTPHIHSNLWNIFKYRLCLCLFVCVCVSWFGYCSRGGYWPVRVAFKTIFPKYDSGHEYFFASMNASQCRIFHHCKYFRIDFRTIYSSQTVWTDFKELCGEAKKLWKCNVYTWFIGKWRGMKMLPVLFVQLFSVTNTPNTRIIHSIMPYIPDAMSLHFFDTYIFYAMWNSTKARKYSSENSCRKVKNEAGKK